MLPPSIGRDDGDADEQPAEEAKPKRRARRPRAESDDDEIAPAA